MRLIATGGEIHASRHNNLNINLLEALWRISHIMIRRASGLISHKGSS